MQITALQQVESGRCIPVPATLLKKQTNFLETRESLSIRPVYFCLEGLLNRNSSTVTVPSLKTGPQYCVGDQYTSSFHKMFSLAWEKSLSKGSCCYRWAFVQLWTLLNEASWQLTQGKGKGNLAVFGRSGLGRSYHQVVPLSTGI